MQRLSKLEQYKSILDQYKTKNNVVILQITLDINDEILKCDYSVQTYHLENHSIDQRLVIYAVMCM